MRLNPLHLVIAIIPLWGCGWIGYESVDHCPNSECDTTSDVDTATGSYTEPDTTDSQRAAGDTASDTADTGAATDFDGTDSASSMSDTGTPTDSSDTGTGLDTSDTSDTATDSVSGDTETDTDTADSDSGFEPVDSDTGDYRVDSAMTLADAIIAANTTPGAQVITVDPSVSVTLTAPLPDITDTVTIIGAGNTIDCTDAGNNKNCLTIKADNVLITNLDFFACPGRSIQISAGSGTQVRDCTFRDSVDAAIHCILATGNNIMGPGNVVTGVTDRGIVTYCDGDQMLQNTVYATGGYGLLSSAANVKIIGNLVVGAADAVYLGNGADATAIWHNTLVKSSTNGILVSASATCDIWNNIIAWSTVRGIGDNFGGVLSNNNNLFFNNTGGDTFTCSPGAQAVQADPLFVDEGTDNYQLQTTSLAIDAGADLGIDVNGASPDFFFGSAPDIGYLETR